MGKAKILIVEDDRIVAEDIKRCVENLKYTVTGIVFSGIEAIRKTKETKPDLILMDIMIKGGMDGIETAQKISADISVPIVYLTAYADNKMINRAKITKPFGYIIKPFNERELYTIIEIALYKHKMENKIKESEEKLHTSLMSIGDGVIATDDKSIITLMNKSAEQITGWSKDESIGKPLKDIFHIINEKTREELINPVEKVIKTGSVIGLANDTVLISKDGKEKIIADSGAPIKDKYNNITGIILVFRDITLQRRIEEEIQINHKIKSIGLLAGGIAHDFNNYLNALLINISNAKMIDDKNEKNEILTVLEEIVDEARGLTKQLLIFSKGGEPIKKTTSLSEIIEKSISIIFIGSNVKCNLSYPKDIWPVKVDYDQVLQVFNNILINADQAMPDGGIITITCENCTIKQDNSLSIQAGTYIKTTIVDQGIGIGPEYIQKIYDPFFTTKNKGSGLGLSIAHSVIKKHDGYVFAHSRIGKGTTFDIYIPASKSKLGIFTGKKEKSQQLSGDEKILIMDDEEFILQGLCLGLKARGYTVATVKDGKEAIKEYKKAMNEKKPYSIVILDLTIPGGLGGKETVKKLKELNPAVKAIVSSGYSNDPILAQYSKYGFSDKLAKPYSINDICLKIRNIIDKD